MELVCLLCDARASLELQLPIRNDDTWRYDQSPLFMATTLGHSEVVSSLLQAGASIEARDTTSYQGNSEEDWSVGIGDYSVTALGAAAMHGEMGVLQILQSWGADTEAVVLCRTCTRSPCTCTTHYVCNCQDLTPRAMVARLLHIGAHPSGSEHRAILTLLEHASGGASAAGPSSPGAQPKKRQRRATPVQERAVKVGVEDRLARTPDGVRHGIKNGSTSSKAAAKKKLQATQIANQQIVTRAEMAADEDNSRRDAVKATDRTRKKAASEEQLLYDFRYLGHSSTNSTGGADESVVVHEVNVVLKGKSKIVTVKVHM